MRMFDINSEDLERLRDALYGERIAFPAYLAQGHLDAAAVLLADIDNQRYGLNAEGEEEKVIVQILRGRSDVELKSFCAEEVRYSSSPESLKRRKVKQT